MKIVFSRVNNYKKLDYIACWFYKGTNYIQNTKAKYAFVTTNSITQGEQVALLWPLVLSKGQEIDFAHQSFKWVNNAKGNAGVTVVIIGVRNIDGTDKFLYNQNLKQSVKNISPYITNSTNIIVSKRTKPLSSLPEMMKGSQPTDGGNLLLSEIEKEKLIQSCPKAKKLIKPFVGTKEFIDGEKKYCIWISQGEERTYSNCKEINTRLEAVTVMRLNSTKTATNKLANVPFKFGEIRYFNKEVIIVPTITSERRQYFPCGILDSEHIVSNTAQAIYDFPIYTFGVLSSRMMVVWVKAVGGKFENRYIFSSSICYNNFPFPDITTKQKENLNLYVFAILDERAKHPSKTMAQLYNPPTMPKGLLQAHQELDIAIEQCYRLQPFKNDTERLEYLFKQYEEMLQKDTLFAKQKQSRKKTVKK